MAYSQQHLLVDTNTNESVNQSLENSIEPELEADKHAASHFQHSNLTSHIYSENETFERPQNIQSKEIRTMINIKAIAISALAISTSSIMAFTPSNMMNRPQRQLLAVPVTTPATSVAGGNMGTPFFATAMPPPTAHVEDTIASEQPTIASQVTDEMKKPVAASKPKPKKAAPAVNHKAEGPLTPIVLLLKGAMGDERLNKLRAKMISIHSDVISSLMDTAETPMGHAILKSLFDMTDADRNGVIEEEELANAFQVLHFDWLKEKQIHGIFERADRDHDGRLTIDEWMREAPKTLRTNLIKLAKKNGGELGLLA
jgi:hypothetical protein